MKIKSLLLGSSLLFFVAAAKANTGPADANDVTKKNDINGGVFHSETKKSISNVSVTAYLTSKKEKTVVTDSNGNYAFDDLRPGIYRLVFEKQGYKKVTKDKVMIRTDEAFRLNIAMVEEEDFDFMPGAFTF